MTEPIDFVLAHLETELTINEMEFEKVMQRGIHLVGLKKEASTINDHRAVDVFNNYLSKAATEANELQNLQKELVQKIEDHKNKT